jgi:hypothetical protein
MKEFYAVEHKRRLGASHTEKEWVEYDIVTLIKEEAESILDCDDSISPDLTDEAWEMLVNDKALKIMDELKANGIYRNEFGQPIFLYC